MQLAYVDKIVKHFNDAKYLLIRQIVWQNRRCKRNENKAVQKNGSCIFAYDANKIWPTKV